MKRLGTVLCCLLLCVITAFAQDQFRYRLVGGVGIVGYIDADVKNTFGFNVGAEVDFLPVSYRSIYLTSGLSVVKKGGSSDSKRGDLKIDAYYMKLPILVRLEKELFRNNDDYKYFAAIGPYMAVGLFGNTKWNDYTIMVRPYPDSDEESKLVPAGKVSTFSKNQLRRFDAGMEGSLGLVFFDRFQVALEGNVAFFNAFRNGNGINQCFSLNFGYIF